MGDKLFQKDMQGKPADLYLQGLSEKETLTKHYMVTPYLPGNSLARRMDAPDLNKYDYVNTIQLAINMIDAVQQLHDNKKIVHGDLGPGNFICDETGASVKIVDYALAKPLAEKSILDKTEEEIETFLSTMVQPKSLSVSAEAKQTIKDFAYELSHLSEKNRDEQQKILKDVFWLVRLGCDGMYYNGLIIIPKNDETAKQNRNQLIKDIFGRGMAPYKPPEYNKDKTEGDIYAVGVNVAILFSVLEIGVSKANEWKQFVDYFLPDVVKYRRLHPNEYFENVYGYLNTPWLWELQIEKELRNIVAGMMHPDPAKRTNLALAKTQLQGIQTRLDDPTQYASLFSCASYNKKWIAVFTIVLITSLVLGCGGWDVGLEMALQETGLSGEKNLDDNVSETKVELIIMGGIGILAELYMAKDATETFREQQSAATCKPVIRSSKIGGSNPTPTSNQIPTSSSTLAPA